MLCYYDYVTNDQTFWITSLLQTTAAMADSLPPPIYSQQEHEGGPQILIIPTADAINFQKGFLGAEGERAAIEGELQIKGVDLGQWSKVSVISFELVKSCLYSH